MDTATTIAHPIQVGANGRHFVDQNNQPAFWLGTTQWQLFREYTLEEAHHILARTAAHGFAFAQVMLMGVGDGTQPNVAGEKPWHNDDPLTPNEAYFVNVDAVLQAAGEYNVAISMTLYHQRYREHIRLENARAWARWLANRYRNVDQIVWSMTPEAKPEYMPILRELAAGLQEGDGGRHLITFKPDPAPYSSSFAHDEPWLDFNAMQTWTSVELIHPMVTHDYGLQPVKPVLMGEGAYEAGTEYDFEVTPLWVRRQAYYSFLAGAYHTYGHNDSWRVLPTWREALDAPGAVQMGMLKQALMCREEWWNLVPDQSLLARGGAVSGRVYNLAARHTDGKWLMAYLAEPDTVYVKTDAIAGDSAEAFWLDPRDGKAVQIGRIPASGTHSFRTPLGWEDALLVLESAG